jgi:hypothetical protein
MPSLGDKGEGLRDPGRRGYEDARGCDAHLKSGYQLWVLLMTKRLIRY